MSGQRTAAIVTVGTEITTGLRLDTNTRHIAYSLLRCGYSVAETVSLPDEATSVAVSLRRLVGLYGLVVVTGGLGPTHDDITCEAAAAALNVPLITDSRTQERLRGWASRQGSAGASARVMRQALVLKDARVIAAQLGTAPGQVITTPGGELLLLPGPPHEMAPMLESYLGDKTPGVAPREFSCTGITESDAQITAQGVLSKHPGVTLALLAKPADVRVILFDAGAGESGLEAAAAATGEALGDVCYAHDGSSLAECVVAKARSLGVTVATAESCTGGLIAAELTSVPGSSAVFRGGVVAYANEVKVSMLDVASRTIDVHGAVSAQTASEMAAGAIQRLDADLAISVTGIAGPEGGSDDKPVGLVWYGLARRDGSIETTERRFPGDRDGVRTRATIAGLDLLRRELARM